MRCWIRVGSYWKGSMWTHIKATLVAFLLEHSSSEKKQVRKRCSCKLNQGMWGKGRYLGKTSSFDQGARQQCNRQQCNLCIDLAPEIGPKVETQGSPCSGCIFGGKKLGYTETAIFETDNFRKCSGKTQNRLQKCSRLHGNAGNDWKQCSIFL